MRVTGGYLEGKKVNSKAFLLLLTVIIALLAVGCRHKPDETKLLTRIQTAGDRADEILIYSVSFSVEDGSEKLALDKHYIRNSRNYDLLVAELAKATSQGVVAKSPPDKQLVFMTQKGVLLRLSYSSADGRIGWTEKKSHKIITLFLSRRGQNLVE